MKERIYGKADQLFFSYGFFEHEHITELLFHGDVSRALRFQRQSQHYIVLPGYGDGQRFFFCLRFESLRLMNSLLRFSSRLIGACTIYER